MRVLTYNLSRDHESEDCFFAESLARLQPMKPLDQNEAVFVGSNQNGSLLSDLQNTLGDFLNHLGFESFPLLHRNVNLVDWEFFRFEHSFYSIVAQPNPKQQASQLKSVQTKLLGQATADIGGVSV